MLANRYGENHRLECSDDSLQTPLMSQRVVIGADQVALSPLICA
jgi:hypothetical protein